MGCQGLWIVVVGLLSLVHGGLRPARFLSAPPKICCKYTIKFRKPAFFFLVFYVTDMERGAISAPSLPCRKGQCSSVILSLAPISFLFFVSNAFVYQK